MYNQTSQNSQEILGEQQQTKACMHQTNCIVALDPLYLLCTLKVFLHSQGFHFQQPPVMVFCRVHYVEMEPPTS